MGYLSGLVALLGLATIMFTALDHSINAMLLQNLGTVIGFVLMIIGVIGFLGTFKKDGE
jgi:hypothetical protein